MNSSLVVFPASNAFLLLRPIQMERFSKQKPSTVKARVRSLPATSVCRCLSHFLLLANLFLKGINQEFTRNAKNLLFLSSFPLSFLQNKLPANTCQHLIAVTQVITRNIEYLDFMKVFFLSLYPGCCFHLKQFFTAVIWSPGFATKRADYVKTKWHWAVKAKYLHHRSQPGPWVGSWIVEQEECLCESGVKCMLLSGAAQPLCSSPSGPHSQERISLFALVS